jgi:hypothetical protein
LFPFGSFLLAFHITNLSDLWTFFTSHTTISTMQQSCRLK